MASSCMGQVVLATTDTGQNCCFVSFSLHSVRVNCSADISSIMDRSDQEDKGSILSFDNV